MALPNIANRAFWKARTSSGSRRSERVVKPETSAKSTVTCRRSASRDGSCRAAPLRGMTPAVPPGAVGDATEASARVAGAGGARGTPHRGQKAKSGSQGAPHVAQATGCFRPQRGQKAKPADTSEPHPAHAIGYASTPYSAQPTPVQAVLRAEASAYAT